MADCTNDLMTHGQLILFCNINNNARKVEALWYQSSILQSLYSELTFNAEYSLNIYCISYDEFVEMEMDFHEPMESLHTGFYV